ncbi:MAG: Hsp20/alpha crystallin family protein [Clostridia bacterium]|nr:Hsp20/alpha crystallin family protein [Clostridia bacterium]MDH7572805.1 Hsp20/alpha crystallin family protein [Clostridia bacterium]
MYHIQVAWPYFSTALPPTELPTATPAAPAPRVDLLESDREVVVIMEVPGSKADQLAVEVHDQQLEVSGSVGSGLSEAQPGLVYRYRERAQGDFRRLLSLPARVDSALATATLREGLLMVRLPKADRSPSQPRKVSIG